jgi:hypothetical protein
MEGKLPAALEPTRTRRVHHDSAEAAPNVTPPLEPVSGAVPTPPPSSRAPPVRRTGDTSGDGRAGIVLSKEANFGDVDNNFEHLMVKVFPVMVEVTYRPL